MKKISLGIAVATVFTCALLLVGYMLYQYLTGDGQKTPYILVKQIHTDTVHAS